jgi:hypothetical protein
MDSARFDRLTRTLWSRRAALGGLATILTYRSPRDAAAQPRIPCRRPRQDCLPERGLDCCEGAQCRNGRCRCPEGQRPCRGQCLSSTRCCGTQCPGALVCRQGRCQCPAGKKRCGGRCIRREACCRGRCGSGQVCRAGRCRPACEGVVCPPCQSCDPSRGVCASCEFCCDGVNCCPPGTGSCCGQSECSRCFPEVFSLGMLLFCLLPCPTEP